MSNERNIIQCNNIHLYNIFLDIFYKNFQFKSYFWKITHNVVNHVKNNHS